MQVKPLTFFPLQQLTTSELLKSARELLGWKQRDLAKASGVSLSTIGEIERKTGFIKSRTETVHKLTHALNAQGIVLLDDSAGAVGVVLKPLKK